MAVCPTCQNTVSDQVKFCPVCGRYLRGTFQGSSSLPGLQAPAELQGLRTSVPPASSPAGGTLSGGAGGNAIQEGGGGSFPSKAKAATTPKADKQGTFEGPPDQGEKAKETPVYAPTPTLPPPSRVDSVDGFVQLHRVIEPFGEINVRNLPHLRQIRATLMNYDVEENTRTALALDGSLSMKKVYGQGAAAKSFFASAQKATNEVQPIARKMASFLSETVDCTGKTLLFYWACGAMGGEIEAIGDLGAGEIEANAFAGPQNFGKGTRLLPILRRFVEQTGGYSSRLFVIVTDGKFDDLDDVMGFTQDLVESIQRKEIAPLKFVLLGVGPEVEEAQMTALDDLDTGSDLDLWDHKLASDLRQMWDVFAEVVDRNKILAPWGRLYDQKGRILKEYLHGLPAVLHLDVPADVTHIALEIAGQKTDLQPLV